MKRHAAPLSEVAVTDGTRHLGQAIPRGDQWEAHSATRGYLAKFETRLEAVRAIIRADKEAEAAA